MAIQNQENINVGLPNESANSDSLYVAFNKTQNNFTRLFACSSPYNTFNSGNGISVLSNASLGTITIENTGVLTIIPGTNITTSNFPNGAVQISSNGGGGNGGGGTVTSVDVIPASYARLTSLGGPITANGTIILDLATSGVIAGTYTYPSLTVDDYGRVTSIANGNSVGTVTSVGVIAGPGIQITGSPVTSNGDITVINSGVIRLNAGSGIALSESTGNITVSSVINGTVTSIEVVSSTLNVSGSPIVTSGSIIVDIPNNFSVTNQFLLPSSEDLQDGDPANLDVVASYFSTSAAETATLADGSEGQIKTFMMKADSGNMVITVTNAGWKTSGTGTITFNDIGDGCILQYIDGKWFCIGNNGVAFG
jgi:hypothetical protein